MSIEKGRHHETSGGIIISDSDARLALAIEQPHDDIGSILLGVARDVSNKHSFVDHQTYPRPNHPLQSKRLAPEFTFAAVITSLRCTLETEQKVVKNLIAITEGNKHTLNSIEIAELEAILRPAGMAKQKSVWIKTGLNAFDTNQEYNLDMLRRMPTEEARRRLLTLKGVGPKAADCFLLLGLDVPVFPVDVNVFRLVAKLFPERITDSPDVLPSFSNPKHIHSTKQLLENSFTRNTELYQVLHTYLLLAEKYKIVV